MQLTVNLQPSFKLGNQLESLLNGELDLITDMLNLTDADRGKIDAQLSDTNNTDSIIRQMSETNITELFDEITSENKTDIDLASANVKNETTTTIKRPEVNLAEISAIVSGSTYKRVDKQNLSIRQWRLSTKRKRR